MASPQFITVPLSPVPPFLSALLEHSHSCRLCASYLNDSPLDADSGLCTFGRMLMYAFTDEPLSTRVERFLHKLERAAKLSSPPCCRCGLQLTKGDMVDSFGREHFPFCPPVENAEPEMEWLRR